VHTRGTQQSRAKAGVIGYMIILIWCFTLADRTQRWIEDSLASLGLGLMSVGLAKLFGVWGRASFLPASPLHLPPAPRVVPPHSQR
jgi:hypothetical protein